MNKRMKQPVCGAALASFLTVTPGLASAAAYTVQKGDNLWLIGTKYSTTANQLKS